MIVTDTQLQHHITAALTGPEADLIATLGPMGRRQKLWLGCFAAVCAWGLIAFIHQLRIGLAATAMNNYFSWGVYIINFVFFIGISHAGTLVSAILRVTGAEWRRPITRMAEGITVFALMIGAPMIIIDMGRPDRILNVIIHGRLQSPILWDVCSVTTYITGSLMYLYLPMIPDLAMLRDHPASFSPWRRKLYRTLALGWTGTPEQKHRLERAIGAMAIVIIPVAVSVHTVVSWIFGMTLRAGWHSTIFGPYFVVGAIFSGIAALITAMAIFVWYFRPYHLDQYITLDHFKKLASLLLAVNLIYIYFTVSEYLTMGYPSEGPDRRLLDSLFSGQYAWQFWTMAIIGLFIPALLLALPWTRTFKGILIASVLINVGMWLKRYVIVVPTLASPFMPVFSPTGKPLSYIPTWVEWSITAGAFSGFCMLYLLFSKVFPIVSIWEIEEGQHEKQPKLVAITPARSGIAPRAGVAVSVLIMVAGLLLTSGRASASEISTSQPATTQPAATQPAAKVALAVVTEDREKLVRATVTALDGKPVENASVQFFVCRTFGDLKLGEDKTLDDGTAAVRFPTGLPGGATGQLQLCAQVKAPAPYVGAYAVITDAGGLLVKPVADPFPRALWAPHAPLPLLIVICSLLAGVWTTYAFVISQIIAIYKGPKP